MLWGGSLDQLCWRGVLSQAPAACEPEWESRARGSVGAGSRRLLGLGTVEACWARLRWTWWVAQPRQQVWA